MSAFVPSHYLVRTPQLSDAVADYEKAGFNVYWGAEKSKAYNAFIYFEKGGFIELFDPPASSAMRAIASIGSFLGVGLMKRFNRWCTSTGFCDFALETKDPLSLAIQGRALSKPRRLSRVQTDGITVTWEVSTPGNADLPFVMGPYDPDPREDTSKCLHPNGIRTLTGMTMSHPDPSSYAQQLAALMGVTHLEPKENGVCFSVEQFEFRIEKAPRIDYLDLSIGEAVSPPSELLHGLTLRHEADV